MDDLQVLILPGWQNSGPEHWQSCWEHQHGFTRVQQDDWLWPRRGDWMARLEDMVLSRRGPLLLAAHSLGCQLVAAWAAHSRHADRVAGALLVAPPDVERGDMPPNLYSWRPIVRRKLPFTALAVVSSNDAYCTPTRAAAMVRDWGARQVDIGAVGHINGDSGLGDWAQGLELLRQVAVAGGLSPTITPW